MSFDEMHDERRMAESSSAGTHAADAPIHVELDAPAEAHTDPTAVEDAPAGAEGPTGFARYRNATLVGAGGLAFAAVGAFLGGLGGYVAVNPVAAHNLASSTSRDQSLAAAANQAHDAASSAGGSAGVATASISSPSGSRTQGVAAVQWLTAGTGSLFATPLPGTPADLAGGTTSGTGSIAGPGSGPGCGATTCDLGLGGVVDCLTTALGSVHTLSTEPTGAFAGLVASLAGTITEVTVTLADPRSLMPTTSLPVPPGALPASGLPGLSGAGSSLWSDTSGITSLLDGVTATAAAAAVSTSPSLPALPVGKSGSSVAGATSPPTPAARTAPPTLPTPAGRAVPPTVDSPGNPTSGSTTTTTTTTTMTVPLPAPPVPSTPPVSVGGVSVGVSTSGSGSGLTLSLP